MILPLLFQNLSKKIANNQLCNTVYELNKLIPITYNHGFTGLKDGVIVNKIREFLHDLREEIIKEDTIPFRA
jgi:hypothetical protein